MAPRSIPMDAGAAVRRRHRAAFLPARLAGFRGLTAVLGGSVPASLSVVVLFLLVYAWPAIRFNGVAFFGGSTWNLGNLYADPITVGGVEVLPGARYGILFLIGGTLLTSFIAILIAVPIGVGAAIFLAEVVPGRLRTWISLFVEMLAAIPSVVFGLWGYAVLIPFLGHHVFPAMASALGFIPYFAGPVGSGYGLLTAGLVLSLMIVPLIAATLRDALVSQPLAIREAATALGATHFETVWKVILPGLRTVLTGACILAIGRALGETMAVLMVSGNALGYVPSNIYGPVSTMAAFIVSQLDSALQDPSGLAVRSLAEIALVLALMSVVVNTVARLILSVARRGEGAR